MPGVGLLNAIDRQRPDGIDAQLVEILLTLRLTHIHSCAGRAPLLFF
jgi:hypothetical protein